MKKIKDVFIINEGFFTQLYHDFGGGWGGVYDDLFFEYNPKDLDKYFLALCGERYAAPVLIYAENISTLTKIIFDHYFTTWIKVKKALFADYDITKPYYIETETSNNNETETITETENTNAAAIYGFDSENAVPNKSVTDSGKNNVTRNENLKQCTRRTGNIGNKTVSELIKAEIETRKITFLTLVMNDIKEFVTLKIY